MAENIYTYLEEKFNIKISGQDYKFKRDYIKEPLQKNKSGFITYIEEPFKEDIEYLYIQLNLSTIKMIQLLNISQRYFNKLCNKFEIKKDTKLVQINVQSSFNEKYGVPFYSQTPEYIKIIGSIMISV